MIFVTGLVLYIVGYLWQVILGETVYKYRGMIIGGNAHNTFGGFVCLIGIGAMIVSVAMLIWERLP